LSTTTTIASAPFDGYSVPAGHFDECFHGDGTPRAAFGPLVDHINTLGRDSLESLVAEGAALVRESGVTYNALEEEGERTRPWELAFTPLVIHAAEWKALDRGLKQRTRLLEAVLDDLLGAQRLLRERILPPDVVLRNPEFLRAYHGLPKSGGVRLHTVATDLARDPNGVWTVTGDRTRAPSGLGYLVENRIITSRAYPELIQRSNIHRIASFFIRLRQMFESLSPRASQNPRVAILTPGQKSYRYFEDTYLARYLGYTLVQGRDLAVRNGVLNLKTLGGLLPIDVLWRHVSDEFCDPLELDPAAVEGVTGLVQAIRSGNVGIANSLGSKLTQSPSLLPFLPAASRFLFGEDLILPTIKTLWCGDGDSCRQVLDDLDRYTIRPAFTIRGDRPTRPRDLSQQARQELVAAIRANPHQYVAQEPIVRSATPVWRDGRMQSWCVALRSFQIQVGNQVEVLPGGLVRVSPTSEGVDNPHSSTQLGQDCWVVADGPVDQSSTLLPSPHVPLRFVRGGAELPSRVAENLFWLGRYSERAEAIARLLRTTMLRLVGEQSAADTPEMPRLIAALAAIGQIEPDYAVKELQGGLPSLDDALPKSLYTIDQQRGLSPSVSELADKATAVRDRISLDAYRIVQQIQEELAQPVQIRAKSDTRLAIARLTRLITGLMAFSGLGSESFTRTLGWRFLQLGRRIERAWQTAELLRATLVNVDSQSRAAAASQTADSTPSGKGPAENGLGATATVQDAKGNPTAGTTQGEVPDKSDDSAAGDAAINGAAAKVSGQVAGQWMSQNVPDNVTNEKKTEPVASASADESTVTAAAATADTPLTPRSHVSDERPILEAVLEATDSIMTYRSRYLLRLEPDATLDLLITDETNPRSILFQLERIAEVMGPLPVEADEVGVPYDRRLAYDLLHRVRMSQPALLATVGPKGRREALDHLLEILTEGLPELSNAIAARYLIHTVASQALTGQV
jgi:uncharacterized circularly permuted ATP-grasp superfamily protein/uncharacterized alpha-E superfamily protein